MAGKKPKIILFLGVLISGTLFWYGMASFQKNLESLIFAKEMEKNPPNFFLANIEKSFPGLSKSEISAQSALSIKIGIEGKKIIFRKNEFQKMPIASLTKLITALTALDFYPLDFDLKISKNAVAQSEENGKLKVGETLSVKDLLYIMLIESSNDAAIALEELSIPGAFIGLLNEKAQEIGMKDSYFFNPTGLDPEDSGIKNLDEINFSTANDLLKLAEYIFSKPLIMEIISKKEYPLILKNGTLHHVLKNTNELLGEVPWAIGGKTGYTERAGGCLLFISKCGEKNGYILSIVLNSTNRFSDVEKIIEYGNRKYKCN